MNDISTMHQPKGGSALTAGVMQQQARELAQQDRLFEFAMRHPRNELACIDAIARAFSEVRTAEVATYQYAKGGTDITGPSIHAAQTIATLWGRIDFGWRELSRGTGEDGRRYSEVESYAIDMQSLTPSRITFIVPHWRDTKGGGYPLKDEREIYELCANMAQRRKRACLLGILPQHVIDMALEQSATTLAAKADTSPEGLQKLVDAFAEFSVTKAQLEARMQRRVDAFKPPQVVALKRIYIALRDGIGSVSDYFAPDASAAPAAEPANDPGAPPPSTADKVKETLRARRKPAAAPQAPAQPGASAGGAADGPGGDDSAAPAAGPITVTGQGQVDQQETDLLDTGTSTADADAQVPHTGPTAEALRDQLMKAPDRDAADMVIDRARHLPRGDYDSLVSLMEQRFPDD